MSSSAEVKTINRNTYPRIALEKADKILKLREEYDVSYANLAKRFNVSVTIIERVLAVARKNRDGGVGQPDGQRRSNPL